MNLIELNRALHQLRLGGMVATLDTRLQQAQIESMAPIDRMPPGNATLSRRLIGC